MKYQNVRTTNQSLFFIFQDCLTKEELSHILTISVTNKLRKEYDVDREILLGTKLIGSYKGYLYVKYPPFLKKYEIYYSRSERTKELVRKCIFSNSKDFFDYLMFCHSSKEMKELCSNLTYSAYRNLLEKYNLRIYCDNYEFTRTKNLMTPNATIKFHLTNYLHGSAIGSYDNTNFISFRFNSMLKSIKKISKDFNSFLVQIEK